jgi:predicted enzyme related to lactoylglutathione lyase
MAATYRSILLAPRRETNVSRDNQIDYVELPANDLDAVESFYSKTFGWEFTDWGSQYRSFSDGALEGGFRKDTETSHTSTGGTLLVLYAENLEATLANVVAHGGRISVDIASFPGGRRFQFLDPHGNELGVWSDK